MGAAELACELDVATNRMSGCWVGGAPLPEKASSSWARDDEILHYALLTFDRRVNAKMCQSCQRSHEITKVEHFKIFRDYIKREDDLIDHRVSWNSIIQGFLFSAYGLSQQKGAPNNLEILGRRIPWFGMALSIIVLLSLAGAVLAHERLRKDWRIRVEPYYPARPYLPGIAAGGLDAAGWLGFAAPVLIPIFFAAAWLLIIFCAGPGNLWVTGGLHLGWFE
jgi:hypothetical protein